MRKWVLGSIGLLIVLMMAVGVGLAQAPTAPEEVKFGYVTYLSGPGAVWGIPLSRGVRIVVDDINSDGGWWNKRGFTVAGRNHTWNLLIEDSALKPDIAAQVTHRLIYQDKVKFILMGAGACCTASAPIANQAGNILFIASGGVDEKVINPNFPLTFKFDNPPDAVTPDLYKAIQDREGVKSIAMLFPNDESGKQWGRGAVPVAKKLEITVVAEEYYERGMTDFFPILTKILAKKPDLIDLTYNTGATQAAIVKQAFELGYRGNWILYAAVPDDLVAIAGKDAAEGAYNWFYLAEPVTEFQKWFTKEYTWRYGLKWDPVAMYHATPLYAVTEAIEIAQSLDPVQVADALEDLEFEMFFGPTHFSGEEHFGIKRQALQAMAVALILDGKAVHAFTLPAPEKY